MSPSDEPAVPSRRFDWRAILLLGWMIAIGLLYTGMVVEKKAPGISRLIRTGTGLD